MVHKRNKSSKFANNDKSKKYSNVIRLKDQSGQSPKRIVAKAIGFGFEYRCPYV